MSDKGTLCCANFFQDVKGVTIDNPDWGGGSRTRGCGGDHGLESQLAFQQAEDEGTNLPSPALCIHPLPWAHLSKAHL